MPSVLDKLNTPLTRQNPQAIDHATARIREQYEQMQHLSISINPLVIIPELLVNSPLSWLKTAGVLGIEPEGENISIIFDPQATGIKTDIKRFVLGAQMMDGATDIMIPFTQGEFRNSPFSTLVTAAVLLARTPLPERNLDKPEISVSFPSPNSLHLPQNPLH